MQCITDNQAIIFIVLAFIVGFGVCWTANIKDDYFDHMMDFDDDYNDRAG